MSTIWAVEAVGTERGRSVLFLRGDKMDEMVVPTDLTTMAKLAALGIRIRNIA